MRLRLLYGVLFLSGIIVLLAPGLAAAHSSGSSWEAKSGNYTVDVGYDTLQFVEGLQVRFDFNVFQGSTTASLYDHVWVRIIAGDGHATTFAAGLLHQPAGPTTLLYQFDVPGEYTFSASFRESDGTEIAAADFPFTVMPSESGVPWPWLFVGVLIGGAPALLAGYRFKRKN